MKYRLIKEYPNSPELGFITDETMYFPASYPEFWELIKPQEWQILYYSKIYKEEEKIYKILRLSDNETFSIDDKVEHSYPDREGSIITKIYTIEKIYILGDNGIRFYVGNGLNLGLEKLKKFTDKKLCNTEDGIAIYEGDLIHFVEIHNEIKYLYCINFVKLHLSLDFINTFKVFSTEKAAKDWIELNKPKYSLKDIEKVFYVMNWTMSSFDLFKACIKQ